MTAAAPGFEDLRSLCQSAVDAGVVPGGVILCAKDGIVRWHEAFGARQVDPHRFGAAPDTVYDVASLTKPVVTSILAMQAVGEGKLALDDPLARHLPLAELDTDDKRMLTVRQTLAHASGLPAHRPFYESHAGRPDARAAIVRAAAREPLLRPPGSASVYSDLGFILLGCMLEQIGGHRLDDAAARRIFEPLAMPASCFVDLADGRARGALLARSEVAPTERCAFRGRLVHGEVHDLNAFAMGGIAGHAGLFSDARDLGAVAAALVGAWRGDAGARLVERDVIREFWRPAGIPGSTWRLGWDGPAERDSQAGARLSRGAVGHLGFTGCSLWIDPEKALWIAFLTNRVHPVARDDPRFRTLRAAVHDAAVDALGA